jgi:hypothetical protein
VFTFDRLPPGEYVFGVNLTKRPNVPVTGSQIFLPGTPRARAATVTELKAGDNKDLGVLRLTNR